MALLGERNDGVAVVAVEVDHDQDAAVGRRFNGATLARLCEPRRVQENGSQRIDYGTAGPVFVAGSRRDAKAI
jgi:hypothetical protein